MNLSDIEFSRDELTTREVLDLAVVKDREVGPRPTILAMMRLIRSHSVTQVTENDLLDVPFSQFTPLFIRLMDTLSTIGTGIPEPFQDAWGKDAQ